MRWCKHRAMDYFVVRVSVLNCEKSTSTGGTPGITPSTAFVFFFSQQPAHGARANSVVRRFHRIESTGGSIEAGRRIRFPVVFRLPQRRWRLLHLHLPHPTGSEALRKWSGVLPGHHVWELRVAHTEGFFCPLEVLLFDLWLEALGLLHEVLLEGLGRDRARLVLDLRRDILGITQVHLLHPLEAHALLGLETLAEEGGRVVVHLSLLIDPKNLFPIK
mmetsp:Transcript_15646/g.38773  ORF Transcript_15646/g.38773 Transcript_15646/m.38773 type:complete len:218 (+) Transcript_15646:407-1060(+)